MLFSQHVHILVLVHPLPVHTGIDRRIVTQKGGKKGRRDSLPLLESRQGRFSPTMHMHMHR